MRPLNPEEGTAAVTCKMIEFSENVYCQKTITDIKSTHPWMTDEIGKLVAEKHAAEGTPDEELATVTCSQKILETRMADIETTKGELRRMKKGSKLWWKKVRYIMGGKAKDCNIPALKGDRGEWVMNPIGKANHISKTLAEKIP